MKRQFAFFAALILSHATVVMAQVTEVSVKSSAELRSLPLEEIMNVQIWSASRKEEKASTAAAAVTVITQEDIRRSGVSSIPEALRLAPGLQVARVDSHQWAISSRGFSATTANKLQVLMDGRSVYSPLFSGVFWDVQDTLIEDIDRIEVIRGPGATLWGANAVNGVVNILTRTSRDTQGFLVTAGGGTEQRAFSSVRYGGKISEDAHFRVYAKGFERDETVFGGGAEGNDRWQQAQGGFRMDWDLSEVSTLRFQGDGYAGRVGQTSTILSPTAPFARSSTAYTDVKGANALAVWSRTFSEESSIQLQAYYDRTHRTIPLVFGEDRDTFDLDFQHRLPIGSRNDMIWGFGYDVTDDEVDNTYTIAWDPPSRTINVVSAFIQDDISVIEDVFRITVGSKFEHNDYTGFEVQPSGRFAWTPAENQTIWGAISRAVRTPSRLDQDIILRGALPPPAPPGSVNVIRGGKDFEAEELLAYELGYRIQPAPRLSVDIAAFYNDYENLRSLEIGTPSSVGGVLVLPSLLANRLSGETFGGELGVQYQLLDWWRLNAGYTLLKKNLRLDPGSTDPTGGSGEGNDPSHQFFLRSFMDLPRQFEFDAALRYVDRLPQPFVPSYVVMDLRLGWRPNQHWEFSIVGQNLLESRHREFGSVVNGREIENSFYAKVTARF